MVPTLVLDVVTVVTVTGPLKPLPLAFSLPLISDTSSSKSEDFRMREVVWIAGAADDRENRANRMKECRRGLSIVLCPRKRWNGAGYAHVERAIGRIKEESLLGVVVESKGGTWS